MGNILSKGLTVAVILLFIGLAVSPSIYANVSKKNESVELDVEFCGLGRKHTVKLTQEEYKEVELIFDEVQERLSNVESDDEAIGLFNEAIVKLDRYGLLGELSVKNAQRLVTGFYFTPKFQKKIVKPDKVEKNSNEFHNSFCYVVGNNISWTRFTGPILSKLSMLFALLIPNNYNSMIDDIIFLFLIVFTGFYEQFNPIAISQTVGFGINRIIDMGVWVYYPAEGNISTNGL